MQLISDNCCIIKKIRSFLSPTEENQASTAIKKYIDIYMTWLLFIFLTVQSDINSTPIENHVQIKDLLISLHPLLHDLFLYRLLILFTWRFSSTPQHIHITMSKSFVDVLWLGKISHIHSSTYCVCGWWKVLLNAHATSLKKRII